jgi:hypothetical protein
MSATDLAAILAVAITYFLSVVAVTIVIGSSVRRMERTVNRLDHLVRGLEQDQQIRDLFSLDPNDQIP